MLAAVRELIGARGEAAAGQARRRARRGGGGWTGRELEAMFARRAAHLRAAGLGAPHHARQSEARTVVRRAVRTGVDIEVWKWTNVS